MHSFEVHSNESACRKSGRLRLEQVYYDLRPIDIVWSNIKDEVGRKYTTQKTFKEFIVRLKESFTHLNSHTVKGCTNQVNQVNQVNQHLKYQHQKIIAIGNNNEDEYSDKYV